LSPRRLRSPLAVRASSITISLTAARGDKRSSRKSHAASSSLMRCGHFSPSRMLSVAMNGR
jgi:hypothetical protein